MAKRSPGSVVRNQEGKRSSSRDRAEDTAVSNLPHLKEVTY